MRILLVCVWAGRSGAGGGGGRGCAAAVSRPGPAEPSSRFPRNWKFCRGGLWLVRAADQWPAQCHVSRGRGSSHVTLTTAPLRQRIDAALCIHSPDIKLKQNCNSNQLLYCAKMFKSAIRKQYCPKWTGRSHTHFQDLRWSKMDLDYTNRSILNIPVSIKISQDRIFEAIFWFLSKNYVILSLMSYFCLPVSPNVVC